MSVIKKPRQGVWVAQLAGKRDKISTPETYSRFSILSSRTGVKRAGTLLNAGILFQSTPPPALRHYIAERCAPGVARAAGRMAHKASDLWRTLCAWGCSAAVVCSARRRRGSPAAHSPVGRNLPAQPTQAHPQLMQPGSRPPCRWK